jgi:TrmH family RNA methyltransferase
MATPRQAGSQAETVTSRDNRWLRDFRAALRRGAPTDEGFLGVEGARLVEEALGSGLEIAAVLTSTSGEPHLERLLRHVPPGARLVRCSDKLFESVADTKTPQGIAALVRRPEWRFEDIIGGLPLVVVLAGVQDPGNVGTVIRSAEAMGASGVATCRAGELGTANPWQPKALRASAGSALRLPIVAGPSAPVLLVQLRAAGLRLFAATLAGGIAPWEADLRQPASLVIGNEGAGLPAEIERSADQLVRIPIEPAQASGARVDSLNASVAAAVLLYEAARQRAGASEKSRGKDR